MLKYIYDETVISMFKQITRLNGFDGMTSETRFVWTGDVTVSCATSVSILTGISRGVAAAIWVTCTLTVALSFRVSFTSLLRSPPSTLLQIVNRMLGCEYNQLYIYFSDTICNFLENVPLHNVIEKIYSVT